MGQGNNKKKLQQVFNELKSVSFDISVTTKRNYNKPFLLAASVTATLDWTLGMYVFIHSINLLGVATTVVITALTPVLTTMTSKTVAREKPSLTNVAGALLTSAGIAITAL